MKRLKVSEKGFEEDTHRISDLMGRENKEQALSERSIDSIREAT